MPRRLKTPSTTAVVRGNGTTATGAHQFAHVGRGQGIELPANLEDDHV